MPSPGWPLTCGMRLWAGVLVFVGCLPGWSGAQDVPDYRGNPPIRFSTVPGGTQAFLPGRWGELKLIVSNSTSEEVQLLSATHIVPDTSYQFGRRFWVPAGARVHVTHPIMIPPLSEPGQESMAARSFLAIAGERESELLPQEFDSFYRELYLRVNDRERWCGLVDDEPLGAPGKVQLAEFLNTARFEMGLRRDLTFIPDRLLPSTSDALDTLDHLVIADNRVASDPAGLAALRDWLFAGGRLWIMLDRVEPELPERLLGNEFRCDVVDRIGLTEVLFETSAPSTPLPSESVSYELPVEHVRVIANGFDVAYTVNSWPAAMWRRFGQGQLLVTTLAADGWVRKRTHDFDPPTSVNRRTDYANSVPLAHLTLSFFEPRTEIPLTPAIGEQHLQGFIGYRIPSRGVILGILTVFTAALAGLGLWLARRGRLEWLAVAGPAAAVLAGGALLAAGQSSKGSIPPTAAVVQFIEPLAGTPAALASGEAGLFLPDDQQVQIAGSHGGFVLPDRQGQEHSTRRMIWTDTDTWRWENLRPTPSLRFASFQSAVPLPKQIEEPTTFTSQGLSGRVTLPEGLVPSDAILAAPAGRMGVTFQSDGRWTSTAAAILARDQYLAADVLSDEQNRRLQTLKTLFAEGSQLPFASEPSLLLWTDPWEMGLRLSEKTAISGSALVAVPIIIERPPPGTQILIPFPWVPFRAAPGPDGAMPSGFYDNRKKVWTEKSDETSTWLRFHPPQALQPLDLRSGQLTIQVSGPVGKIEVGIYNGREVQPIKVWIDPIGKLTLDLSDPTVFQTDEDGSFLLRIAGGDSSRPELTRASADSDDAISYWRLESLTLDLQATVRARTPTGG